MEPPRGKQGEQVRPDRQAAGEEHGRAARAAESAATGNTRGDPFGAADRKSVV